ncbi:MAG: hypothetical protein WEC75_01685 [Dehalococcoidia bacterium]
MPEYLIGLDPSARRSYEKVAISTERVRIDRILQSICVDPVIDDETKFAFRSERAGLRVYMDAEFWVVYEVVGPGSIVAVNMGFEEEPPRVEREEPLL